MNHSAIRRALNLLAACAFLSASARAGVVLSGGGLALVEEGGTLAPGNLAASGTAFAKDLLPGYAAHTIPNLNDQLFGNSESWIGNTSGTFAGLSFGATPVPVSSIAFGRDNNGGFTDRTLGLYTLQYTTEPNPTNATTAWTTIGTLDYGAAGGTNYAFPSRRHRYAFNTVTATGIRLLVPAGGPSAGTCIDELEAYSSTSIVVANTADSGAGSLRQAILAAAAASGPTHIAFAPALSGQTITLASEIVISNAAPVAIDATSLASGITINGGTGDNRIFSIPAGQTVTLNRLTLTGGGGAGTIQSGFGGAIYNASSLLTLTNCSFQGNSGSYGAGIYNISSSPTLTNCSFQGNSASTDGGGIYNNSSSPTLTNCSFQGNSASAWGGGMFNVFSSPTLLNCSFQGNRATGYAGGIFNHTSSSPTLTNCSFQGNSAGSPGGGIFNYNSSSPTLNNCIIWKNKDDSGIGTAASSVSNLTSSTPTYSHCLIQGYSKAQLDAGTSPDTNLASTDPLFVLEVDPDTAPHTTGGDLRLRLGSPAINAGSGSLNGTLTDLAGRPRTLGNIDLGAYEFWGVLYVKSGASASNTGSSWADALPHLQDALAVAQAGDEIWVATGTYFPDEGTGQTNNSRTSTFALKPGVALYGGFLGSETSFSQRNPATNPTTLSGDLMQNDGANFANNADNAYNVLVASGAAITASTILDGFTITAGNANDGFAATRFYSGGGLYCEFASPTLTNCSFQGNSAVSGGGIYFEYSSSPTLTNCSFQGNHANYGAGISNYDASPTLTNCSFQGNSAEDGGGIFNYDASPTLTNCSFQGNSASGSCGGMFNFSSSPTLTNCSFQGNSATYNSGGMFNGSSSSPTLTNCSFQGNSGEYGGGIYNQDSSSPTLTNCSFQGNSASADGGGIYNSFSSPTLTNCIIWNNAQGGDTTAPGASVSNFYDSTPTYSHCLIQGLNPVGTGNLDGTLPSNAPLFVREVDPNLPVQQRTGGDLRLLSGSPALNVGDDTKNSTPTDLAGNPRKVGIIDLGAYEGNVNATFALLHPTLSPSGDANGNGISNFGDYAAGGNPSAPDDPSLRPKLIGDQLTFSFRNNAADLTREFQKSTTLLSGSWQQLIETTDYTVTTTVSSGGRSLQTLTLTNALRSSNPKLFFRQEFTSIPPP